MNLCKLATTVFFLLLFVVSEAQEVTWDAKNQAQHCEIPGNDLKSLVNTRLQDCNFSFYFRWGCSKKPWIWFENARTLLFKMAVFEHPVYLFVGLVCRQSLFFSSEIYFSNKTHILVNSKGSLICVDTIDCTHFTWLDGLCKLKTGEVFPSDAQLTDNDQVCAVLQKASSTKCRNMWDITQEEYSSPTDELLASICPG